IETRWNSFFQDYPIDREERKQRTLGTIYGTKDFLVRVGIDASYVGYGLTVPFRAPLWMMGISSPSRDWRSFQASNEAFRNAAERWMQNMLPADMNHPAFRSARPAIENFADTGFMLAGGLGLAKGIMSAGRLWYTTTRAALSSKQSQQSIRLYSRELGEVEKIQKYTLSKSGIRFYFPNKLVFQNTNRKKLDTQKIDNAVKGIENFIGGKGKIITNADGDMILMGGNKKIRFDIKDPHGFKPHFHLEHRTQNGKWIDASSEHRYYLSEE
ncbi:MAG TPA: hypothetical protein VKR53_03185, partial [Puia sp.]|nr:hypothetical protein [Puia sp.]